MLRFYYKSASQRLIKIEDEAKSVLVLSNLREFELSREAKIVSLKETDIRNIAVE